MPETGHLLGALPLACAGEELRRTADRLAALAGACARPCEGLLAALDRLPAAARVEPFPAQPPASRVGAAFGREPSARPRSRRPAPEARPPAAASQSPSATPASPPPAEQAALLRGRSLPIPNPQLQSQFAAGGRSYEPEAAPASLGTAVAALLARWPDAPDRAPAHAAAPMPPPGTGLAGTPLGPWIQNLVARSSGRPTAKHAAPARQFARVPVEFDAATAASVAEWLARHAPAQAVAGGGLGGLAAALAEQPAPSLLARLVASFDATAQPAAASAVPRQPAPRAQPRLTQPTGAEASVRQPKDAPAGDAAPGQEAGEVAQQLNRLLLDQAWLRGVDLT